MNQSNQPDGNNGRKARKKYNQLQGEGKHVLLASRCQARKKVMWVKWRCLVKVTTWTRALIGYGALRKRLFNRLQISKRWKTKTENVKSHWKTSIKTRHSCLELCCISKVSTVNFFDLFDPLNSISCVIFQVINTFWLRKKKNGVFFDGDTSQTVYLQSN